MKNFLKNAQDLQIIDIGSLFFAHFGKVAYEPSKCRGKTMIPALRLLNEFSIVIMFKCRNFFTHLTRYNDIYNAFAFIIIDL